MHSTSLMLAHPLINGTFSSLDPTMAAIRTMQMISQHPKDQIMIFFSFCFDDSHCGEIVTVRRIKETKRIQSLEFRQSLD